MYINPTSILDLVVIVDKYQCTSAVSAATRLLFDRYDPTFWICNPNLIVAAYVLDDAKYFQRYTNILVRRCEPDRALRAEQRVGLDNI